MAELTLDRDRLHDAMNMCVAEKLYAWGSSSLSSQVKLASLGIRGVGTVKLPLDKKRLQELCIPLASARTPPGSGPIIVNKNLLYEPENTQVPFKMVLKDLATTAIQETFNIKKSEFNFNVDAELNKLVICSRDEMYRGLFNLEKEPGTFGTLLIQIPVQEAQGGGSVSVHYKEESICLELDSYSANKYYVTLIAAKRSKITIKPPAAPAKRQEFTIQALHSTPCVMLIASLIWTDSVSSLPKIEGDRFPQFIETAYQARHALSGWRNLVSGTTPPTEEAHWVNTNAVNPTGHFFVRSKVEGVLPLLDAKQTKAICLPLRHNYCLEKYQLTSLADEDALISRVLHSFDFLDIQLVLIKKTGFPTQNWRLSAVQKVQEKIEMFKPISREASKILPFSVNVGENFTGNLQGGITCSNLGSAQGKCTSCNSGSESQVFYGAFLIQPKIGTNFNKQPVLRTSQPVLTPLSEQKQRNFEDIQELIKDFDKTQDTARIRTKISNLKDPAIWKTFTDTLMQTQISRAFRSITKLTQEFQCSSYKEEVALLIQTMIQLFVRAVTEDCFKNPFPYLVDLMKALEMSSASTKDFVQSVKLAMSQLTAFQLASAILQSNGSRKTYLKILGKVLREKEFSDLTVTQILQLSTLYVKIDKKTVEELWTKVCSDTVKNEGKLLLSIIAAPKEDTGRGALVPVLSDFSEVAKQALDVLVDSIGQYLNAEELTELFLFLLLVQSDEKLASVPRLKKFFSVLYKVKFETLFLLQQQVKSASVKERPVGVKMYRTLMEHLIKQYFEEIVSPKTPLRETIEFIDNAIWLENEDLNNCLVSKIISSENLSISCFHSTSLSQFILNLLDGLVKLHETYVVPLVKLWVKHQRRFIENFNISASVMIKAFIVCFPLSAPADTSLSKKFTDLVLKLEPKSLVEFLVDVYELSGRDAVLGNSAYLDILTAACSQLTSDSLLTVSFEKLLILPHLVLRLKDDEVVNGFLLQVLAIPNFAQITPLVYQKLRSFVASLEQKKKAAVKSWAVKDVVVPINKKLEDFLRSERRNQVFGMFASKEKADNVACSLAMLSPSPVQADVKQEGGFFVCELTKTDTRIIKPIQPQSKRKVPSSPILVEPPPPPLIPPLPPSPPQPPPPPPPEEPTGEWSYEDALVPNNLQLQNFLRSNLRTQRFPKMPLLNARKAAAYAQHLTILSPYLIDFEIEQVGNGFFCNVTKMHNRYNQPYASHSSNWKSRGPPIVNSVGYKDCTSYPAPGCYAQFNAGGFRGSNCEPPSKRRKLD